MTPKQRGPGQSGNTSHGHRSNRVNSMRRGGNPHAGGGGAKPPKGCLGVLLLVALAGVPAAGWMVAQVIGYM